MQRKFSIPRLVSFPGDFEYLYPIYMLLKPTVNSYLLAYPVLMAGSGYHPLVIDIYCFVWEVMLKRLFMNLWNIRSLMFIYLLYFLRMIGSWSCKYLIIDLVHINKGNCYNHLCYIPAWQRWLYITSTVRLPWRGRHSRTSLLQTSPANCNLSLLV